jgi:hypothetical protein
MFFFLFNKIGRLLFLLLGAGFLLLSLSCTKKMRTNNYKIVFDTIQVNEIQSVKNKKINLNCNLHISFTYPISCNDTTLLNNLQKLFIEKFLPPRYAAFPPQDAINHFSKQYILDFKSLKMEDFVDEEQAPKDTADFAYELNLKNEIIYNQNRFISFIVKSNNYEGGAHGSNNISGYVIDLNTGKFLTEDDFSGNNYNKNLASIIVHKIAEANHLKNVSQLEEIGYNHIDDIVPNENFTIDDKGITYYFNEYEIAAYFVGLTKVFIPYEELNAFLAKDSPISSLAGL